MNFTTGICSLNYRSQDLRELTNATTVNNRKYVVLVYGIIFAALNTITGTIINAETAPLYSTFL